MSIEFVLGNTLSSKDEYLEEKIAHLLKEDVFANILVVVPPHLTFYYETTLLKNLNLKGSFGISVQSPNRIAQNILNTVYGKVVKSIDSTGKALLIRNIINKNITKLKSLGASGKKANIAVQIADLITEFKMMDITPNMLLELKDYPNEKTQNRIEDIAFIYEEYLKAKGDNADNEDKFNLAIDCIKNWEAIKNANVFITAFENLDSQRLRFTKEIMATAKNTVISFLYEEPNHKNANLYDICNYSREKLIAYAKGENFTSTLIKKQRAVSEDIAHLANNIFAYIPQEFEKAKDVSLTYAQSEEEEIKCVAAQIAYLNSKAGIKFSDMAIVYSGEENYKRLITETFDGANIPVFTGERRLLSDNPFAKYLLLLLKMCKGKLIKDNIVSFGKTGFVLGTNMDIMQNYIYSKCKDGFSLLKEINTEQEEEYRKNLMAPIVFIREACKNLKYPHEILEALINYIETTGAKAILDEQIINMHKKGYIKSGEYTAQVYEKALRILKLAKEVFYNEEMSKTALYNIIKDTMDSTQINIIPPLTNEIQVSEVSQVGVLDFYALFMVGVNEEKIPDYSTTDDLLTDKQREFILDKAVGVKHLTKTQKQRISLLKAFSAPKSKLFVSCVKNETTAASPLIYKIKEIFKEIKINDATEIIPLLKENVYTQTAQTLRKLSINKEITQKEKEICASLLKEKDARTTLMLNSVSAKNHARYLNKETAKLLYKENKGSASRFETFYRCPYKHFMQYGIKPKIYEEYVLNYAEMGTYAHSALELYLQKLKKADAKKITDAQLKKIIGESKKEAKEINEKYCICKKNSNMIAQMDKEIDICANTIKNQLMQSKFEPFTTEYAFTQKIGENIEITGKIDRIDIAQIEGNQYITVIDYKTGSANFSLSNLFFGLNTQLLIYILAARELYKNGIIAGAHYFSVHMPILDAPTENLDNDYKMSGITQISPKEAQELYGTQDSNFYSLRLSVTKNGEFSNTYKGSFFDEEEIKSMLNYTQKLIINAFEEINGGSTQIMPIKEGSTTSCTYCDFASICMYDKETNPKREVIKQEKEYLIKEMSK